VPAYAYQAGIRDFSDIQRFGPALNYTVYGIEAGNDGNRHILTMIQTQRLWAGVAGSTWANRASRACWRTGGTSLRLGQADRVPGVGILIPMNMQFDLHYLSGGGRDLRSELWWRQGADPSRGPGMCGHCLNVGRLLQNLVFTTHGESEVMRSILSGP